MAITYEDICKKLGFEPGKYNYKHSDHEDDSKESPYSILTSEELDFLCDYYAKNILPQK